MSSECESKPLDKSRHRLISGSSNRELAQKISDEVGIPLTKCDITRFANSETRVRLNASVRKKHIYIIQTGGYDTMNHVSVNDYIMEVLIIMDAVKRSGAKSITLVCPCYPYARQDKKDEPRAAISSSMVATILQAVGLDRMVIVDLHAASIQGVFDMPCDNLYCIVPVFDYLKANVFINSDGAFDEQYADKFVAVSPDEGAIKRTSIYAQKMGLKMMVMSKTRNLVLMNVVEKTVLLGNPEWLTGKIPIIFDDIIDTGRTIIKSVQHLKEKGSKAAIVVASHGVFSGDAVQNLHNCEDISSVVVSDSLSQTENLKKSDKLHVFTIGKMCGEVVRRLATGESISELFE